MAAPNNSETPVEAEFLNLIHLGLERSFNNTTYKLLPGSHKVNTTSYLENTSPLTLALALYSKIEIEKVLHEENSVQLRITDIEGVNRTFYFPISEITWIDNNSEDPSKVKVRLAETSLRVLATPMGSTTLF